MDLTKILKPGDKVWTIQHGWVGVDEIDRSDDYPLIIRNPLQQYTKWGGLHEEDKHPSLFLKEQVFDLSIPEPVFEQDELVWARFVELWIPLYYKHKEKDGSHFLYKHQLSPKISGSTELEVTVSSEVRKWEDSPFKDQEK